MSIQIIPTSLEKTGLLTVIKNEPPESEFVEVGMDGIIESSKKEIIQDIKNIDIVWHPLCENSVKSEIVPENIPETNHLQFVETQVLVKAENVPFIKIESENLGENLNKTEYISYGNVQEVEVKGNLETKEQLVRNFYSDLNDISTRGRSRKYSKKTDVAECYKITKTTFSKEDKETAKVIEAPVVIPVQPQEYTSLAKDEHVCNHCQHACKTLGHLKLHIRSKHRELTTMYKCPYCPHKSKWSVRDHIIRKHKDTKDIQWFQCHLCEMKFKLEFQLTKHMVIHSIHEQVQDCKKIEFCQVCGKGFTRSYSAKRHMRFVHDKEEKKKMQRKCRECEYTTTERKLLEHHIKNTHKIHERYPCDNCDYKTDRHSYLTIHKLIHLKPEEVRYFYCYHCSYSSIRKTNLSRHIFRHFKNGEVPFHCYICNYMTRKREAIIEHIKKHSRVQIKSEIKEES